MRGARRYGAVPAAYGVLALVALVVLLPSALRPPADPASTAAEFSPDAPPDDQDSIVAALSRGSSATAGAGTGEGASPGEGVELAGPSLPPAPPRACPLGFGNPPRQTESVYSAPCASPFRGDNGGATARGVTANEIRIAVIGGGTGTEGPLSPQPEPGESSKVRTLRVLQDYFNARYELYGRQLRFVNINSDLTQDQQEPAAVQAAEEFRVFGAVLIPAWGLDMNAKRDTVAMGTDHHQAASGSFFSGIQPYAWSWWMDGTRLMRLNAEYLCKQLVGREAKFAGDPAYRSQTRRLGLIAYDDPVVRQNTDDIQRFMSETCGARFEEVVQFHVVSGPSQYQTAVARFKAENITTVVYIADVLSLNGQLAAAETGSYSPEWYLGGTGLQDRNEWGRRYPPGQWANAFGITTKELPRPPEEEDFYRAYKSVDPANEPQDIAQTHFSGLLMMINGIQLAGPKLTPETFKSGLFSAPKRPNDPIWSIGGGFAPGDFTFQDDVAELWWDPAATDPYDGQPGAYRYTRGGRRYGLGQIPSGEQIVFSDGVTSNFS